ncbi:MAG: flagellar biosynthesis anti-sigma factor FlgM [Gammaproteobacteria bacterium]|nr:MAG: flagellar biosynthesis anti-sigma factor FlgM [Gammaproteobacteria bacterium]
MVIDTNNINSGGTSGARGRTTAPVTTNGTKTSAPAPAEAAVSGSKDNVVLSSEAQNMVRLQAKISSLPDVNLDRVAAIKQAIAEGRFEINPERIAENMLKQDELLS